MPALFPLATLSTSGKILPTLRHWGGWAGVCTHMYHMHTRAHTPHLLVKVCDWNGPPPEDSDWTGGGGVQDLLGCPEPSLGLACAC